MANIKTKKPDDQWSKNVSEAKKIVTLLKLNTKHRMRVAELAIKSCTILHGGRPDDDVTTRGKFADAIGVHRHTLYEWVKVYQNVLLKLKPEQQEDALSGKYQVMTTMRRKVKAEYSPRKVQAQFDKEIKKSSGINKMENYLYSINGLLYNGNNPRLITDVPTEMLEKIVSVCRQISDLYEKEIRLRDSGEKSHYEVTKPDLDKVWEQVLENDDGEK